MSGSLELTVRYEDAGDGWVTAQVLEVPGAVSEGRGRHEARANVIDALQTVLTPDEQLAGRLQETASRSYSPSGGEASGPRATPSLAWLPISRRGRAPFEVARPGGTASRCAASPRAEGSNGAGNLSATRRAGASERQLSRAQPQSTQGTGPTARRATATGSAQSGGAEPRRRPSGTSFARGEGRSTPRVWVARPVAETRVPPVSRGAPPARARALRARRSRRPGSRPQGRGRWRSPR